MEYKKLTAQIKGCEDEYTAKVEEAKKSYDELVEKYFNSMRGKIVEVIKDVSDEEFDDWLHKAAKDDAISPKLFALVEVCRIENRAANKEDEAATQEACQDLIMDVLALGLLRRLI